jgi:hypothetical protein
MIVIRDLACSIGPIAAVAALEGLSQGATSPNVR